MGKQQSDNRTGVIYERERRYYQRRHIGRNAGYSDDHV
jgi:hypothetical protein